uniref:Uncharacterized protein n=1 Tax=Oryza meridionalis TaxID=40149 RepID=A0A0E0CKL2_9ORYZ
MADGDDKSVRRRLRMATDGGDGGQRRMAATTGNDDGWQRRRTATTDPCGGDYGWRRLAATTDWDDKQQRRMATTADGLPLPRLHALPPTPVLVADGGEYGGGGQGRPHRHPLLPVLYCNVVESEMVATPAADGEPGGRAIAGHIKAATAQYAEEGRARAEQGMVEMVGFDGKKMVGPTDSQWLRVADGWPYLAILKSEMEKLLEMLLDPPAHAWPIKGERPSSDAAQRWRLA